MADHRRRRRFSETARGVNPGTVLRVTCQRNQTDCAIACLTMLSGGSVSYEDVLIHAARIGPCEGGMWLHQIEKVASELGMELERKRPGRYSLETDTGILHVYSKRRCEYHVTILWGGRIVDTDGSCWSDADVYLATRKYKAGALLVEA
jgi:hypothetical protein